MMRLFKKREPAAQKQIREIIKAAVYPNMYGDDVMREVDEYLATIKDMPDYELEKVEAERIARIFMSEILRDCVCSGRYHWYAGTLNNAGVSMRNLYMGTLYWAESHGYMTEEDRDITISTMWKSIRGQG